MQKLYEIIAKLSNEKSVNYQLTDETDLIIEHGYDSLKFIQLISEIEEEFQIEFDIDDIDIEKFRSVNYLIQLINKKIGDKENG